MMIHPKSPRGSLELAGNRVGVQRNVEVGTRLPTFFRRGPST